MGKETYETYRNRPVHREITDLIPGSWQEAARNSGMMRFFEPLPPAERSPQAAVSPDAANSIAATAVANTVNLTLTDQRH